MRFVILDGLLGPYVLSAESVDEHACDVGPGVYSLGQYDRNNDVFYVNYVGRSDINLNLRLHQHERANGFSYFKYAFYRSVRFTYEKECVLWHKFGGLELKLKNKRHPDSPDGEAWQCPVCGE